LNPIQVRYQTALRPDTEGALHELVKDLFRREDIPIVAGLDIGHGNCNRTIPLGIAACLDSGSGTLEFLTAAVGG
jgi:muramoyltetrapeptide carboxypeptidase LdcA involved in peptidoglycan recycling